jgi:hypothetical protein
MEVDLVLSAVLPPRDAGDREDRCLRALLRLRPWFDIDWILRWRRERICFPDIFVRPSISTRLRSPTRSRPRAVRAAREAAPGTIEALAGAQGSASRKPCVDAQAARSFGARARRWTRCTSALRRATCRRRCRRVPPCAGRRADVLASKDASPHDAVRGAIAARWVVDFGVLQHLDLARFIGPFRRCIDIFVPEWQLVFDVPDITFRVTQDTNGDGIEETIYSEGYFDVRWDAGAIPTSRWSHRRRPSSRTCATRRTCRARTCPSCCSPA